MERLKTFSPRTHTTPSSFTCEHDVSTCRYTRPTSWPLSRLLSHTHVTSLHTQGNFPSAIKHLQEALRNDPDNSACAKDIKMIRKLERGKQAGNTAFAGTPWHTQPCDTTACHPEPNRNNVD